MSGLQRWLLRKLFRQVVRQGAHRQRTSEVYALLREAAAQEFTEDSPATLDGFLQECFDSARALPKLA